MPNRIIRPEILTSEKVDRLSLEAEVFYRRLMSVVDDYGRFHANPLLLLSACFPLRVHRLQPEQVAGWMQECLDADLLIHYRVDDRSYLEVAQFRQRTRAKDSRFPDPPGAVPSDDRHVTAMRPADAHVDVDVSVDEGAAESRSRDGTHEHGALNSFQWKALSDQEVRRVVRDRDLTAFLNWDESGLSCFRWPRSDVARIHRAAFWHRAAVKKIHGRSIDSPAAYLVARMKDSDVTKLENDDYDWARLFLKNAGTPVRSSPDAALIARAAANLKPSEDDQGTLDKRRRHLLLQCREMGKTG